ncbi:MAG: hypothetical protein AB8G23_09875 [Myxococcota bacterium]
METFESLLAAAQNSPALQTLTLLTFALLLTHFWLKRSDGPRGPFPGGPLRAGEIVTEHPADWSRVGEADFAEIEVLATGRSRITGLLEHDGALFIPCDLGFVWRRVAWPAQWAMALVWLVKNWHESVQKDGRVVTRIRGKRYLFRATRVEAPHTIQTLKAATDSKAQTMLGSRLAPRAVSPSEGEREIWFFRLDPR